MRSSIKKGTLSYPLEKTHLDVHNSPAVYRIVLIRERIVRLLVLLTQGHKKSVGVVRNLSPCGDIEIELNPTSMHLRLDMTGIDEKGVLDASFRCKQLPE